MLQALDHTAGEREKRLLKKEKDLKVSRNQAEKKLLAEGSPAKLSIKAETFIHSL